MRRKIDPIPGNGAALDEAWCFAFFGVGACSGAIIVVLSGTSAGAASTSFGGSAADGGGVAVEIEEVAGAEAVTAAAASALPEAGAGAIGLTPGCVGATATGKDAFADSEAAEEDSAGAGAAAFVADVDGRACRVARDGTRGDLSGLSFGATAAAAAGGSAGFVVVAAGAAVVIGAAATVGATDGTAAARTLVTMARAATGTFSGSLGRSSRDSTTPAPAVAPIAVATRTTRAVRAKLGAGAK